MTMHFHHCRAVCRAAATLLLAAAAASAQGNRTTVVVGAGDASTGQFLPGVQVQLGVLKIVQYTDSKGQAYLPKIPPGTYTIEARRVGYQPISAPILVRSEDSLGVVLLMKSTAKQLDTVHVAGTIIPIGLSEFESRRMRGLGHFVTRAQIDSVPGATLTAIVESHLPGLTVVGDPQNGMHVMSFRQSTEAALRSVAGPCFPTVYLDGTPLPGNGPNGPDLSELSLGSIGGIEFYPPSEAPVQYRGAAMNAEHQDGALSATGRRGGRKDGVSLTPGAGASPSCGVMLIWSRP